MGDIPPPSVMMLHTVMQFNNAHGAGHAQVASDNACTCSILVMVKVVFGRKSTRHSCTNTSEAAWREGRVPCRLFPTENNQEKRASPNVPLETVAPESV